ncbi:MAG: sigma-70 family RNA polymerase sigma factor [Candidatus Aminicenantes bacterium]|nr:sigma-70 family RNA polymerase sigma factor [Candidatus Aminicenantes bacterium]
MGAPTRPAEHPEDAVLVRKAQQGDMDAFESLVRNYQQRVYALCRRLTGAHQSADDLAQETFIKAYYALGRFDAQWPLYPWLRRIALNSGLNYLKARKRERPLFEGTLGARRTPFSAPADSPEEQLERAEFEARFERAVASLAADQRSVFVLRFHESMSYEEISRTLDLPIGTVMSRLNRARQKLKSLLTDSLARGA